MAVLLLAKNSAGQVYDGEDNIFAQPVCHARPDEGGGGGSGGEEEQPVEGGNDVYLCFYEVWTDQNGFVIEKILLGCKYVGGELLRV